MQEIIEITYEDRAALTPSTASDEVKQAISNVIDQLNTGELRICEQNTAGDWIVNQWIKKAVLLSFRINDNQVLSDGVTQFYDKVSQKYTDTTTEELQQQGVRIVPPAYVRTGSYVGGNTVLMPCYVNIGAYIDEGCMIDTWATVGSCAQIGKNVHISGGAGIGGVLEPLQNNPCIIEDNCFIGARSEIVEGVIVERNSVISMGVYIGQSTKIYHRDSGEISYGRIPEGSVVVSGNLPAKDGSHSLYCAVIVKQVDDKTRAKVSINELLRGSDDKTRAEAETNE